MKPARCWSRRCCGTISSAISRPITSSARYPNVSSAAGLNSSTRPRSSIVMMQSSADSRIAVWRASRSRIASSARLRSTNCPIWPPRLSVVASSSSSGSCGSSARNSIAPTTPRAVLIGKQNPERNPESIAAWTRGKFGSSGTSGIQKGSPVDQTRPGSPNPGANDSPRLNSANAASRCSAHQVSTQRTKAACTGSSSHTAPYCQPSAVAIDSSSFGYASETASFSARMRATSCSSARNFSPARGASSAAIGASSSMRQPYACTCVTRRVRSRSPERGYPPRSAIGRSVVSNGVTEEPISSELALVDQALGRRARAALPDPPWLVPALAELRERPPAEPVPAPVPEPPAPAPERHRGPSAGTVVLVVVALAFAAVSALAFVPQSHGPTLVTTPAEQAAPAAPVRPPTATSPGAATKPKSTQPQRTTTPRKVPATRAPGRRQGSKPAATPKPRVLTRAQRVVTWRRFPAAVYYAVYLQHGANTVYQATTVRPGTVLPARLAGKPGTYHLVVRPAIPNDAGINLGPAIVRKTLKL